MVKQLDDKLNASLENILDRVKAYWWQPEGHIAFMQLYHSIHIHRESGYDVSKYEALFLRYAQFNVDSFNNLYHEIKKGG